MHALLLQDTLKHQLLKMNSNKKNIKNIKNHDINYLCNKQIDNREPETQAINQSVVMHVHYLNST